MEKWFDAVGLAPNSSRLFKNIKGASWSKTGKGGILEIHGKALIALEQAFPELKSKSEEIVNIGAILPKDLYEHVNRKFVQKIADQVNSSYESAAYDACAVMMRRLLEILLIHVFRNKGLDDEIKKPDGYYLDLDLIINLAVVHKKLGLTQGAIKELKLCKDVGNYGAHDIIYTCKKQDLDPILMEYRKVIAHLIEYAGFNKT